MYLFDAKEIIERRPSKPFLKWAGGKTQLLHEIDTLLPDEFKVKNKFSFIEPFIGSGAILFHILNNYKRNLKSVVINDLNPNLVSVYEVIKNELEELKEELRSLHELYSTSNDKEEFYYNSRDEYNLATDKVGKSALFLFLNKTCFNGLYRENSKGQFNVPFGKYKNPKIFNEELLDTVHHVFNEIDILALAGDYFQTIDYCIKGATLFYLDPPYKPISKTSSFTAYSKGTFDDKEQERLKMFCDELTNRGCYFILSNSDLKNYDKSNHFFDNLYSDYKIKRVKAKRVINSKAEKRGEINELLITNFDKLSN
jgi:DNA adenine methylase